MTSSTASPATQLTGLPPAEEKKLPSLARDSAMSRRVSTAPSGYPLPIALATVRMSGTTPCCCTPQKWLPSRP